jgi:ribosome-binding protein aMBF1 (putative translation factor)
LAGLFGDLWQEPNKRRRRGRESKSSNRQAILKFGIAQRQIRIKYCHKPRKWQTSSPMGIKTIGDWIRVKRRERNLIRYHLATRMDIATALIRSWENDFCQPDSRQLKDLSNRLGFGPSNKGSIPFARSTFSLGQ